MSDKYHAFIDAMRRGIAPDDVVAMLELNRQSFRLMRRMAISEGLLDATAPHLPNEHERRRARAQQRRAERAEVKRQAEQPKTERKWRYMVVAELRNASATPTEIMSRLGITRQQFDSAMELARARGLLNQAAQDSDYKQRVSAVTSRGKAVRDWPEMPADGFKDNSWASRPEPIYRGSRHG